MWNNPDSLRYVWCYANSCSNLSKAQHRRIADQTRREKSQRACCSWSGAGWKWRGHTDLLWSLFMSVSVSDHGEECLQSYRRTFGCAWCNVLALKQWSYFSKGSRNVTLSVPVQQRRKLFMFAPFMSQSFTTGSVSLLFSLLFSTKTKTIQTVFL